MADRDFNIALTVKTHVEAAVKDLDRMEKELKGAGTAADRSATRMRRFGAAIDRAARGSSVLGRHLRYLTPAAFGFSAGRILRDVVRNTVRQEQAIAQVEARIRATGGAAGVASEEIQRMAAALQDVTAYGDEAIL